MRRWQNRQLRGLSRLADVIFVSTTRWESEIKEVSPKAVCHHLPVGSNLPCSRLSREDARKNLRISADTLVLGMFGSSHPSRMNDWMSPAVRGAASVQDELVVLYVGKDGRAFREVCAGVPFMDQGPLPAEAAADRLRSMDLLISPFADGLFDAARFRHCRFSARGCGRLDLVKPHRRATPRRWPEELDPKALR